MATAPDVTFQSRSAPYPNLASLNYAQSSIGGGNLPVLGGENSNTIYFRIYNNWARAAGVASMDNVKLTVFDDADPSSHTAAKSPVSQSWVRVYESGYGENSITPGLITAWVGDDTAIGRSGIDSYAPEFGSDGSSTAHIRAGTDTNGVGFIEFATYMETPDQIGFFSWTFAVSIVYDWTS